MSRCLPTFALASFAFFAPGCKSSQPTIPAPLDVQASTAIDPTLTASASDLELEPIEVQSTRPAVDRETRENATVAALWALFVAQRHLQASGAIDADQDGTGEFGTFGEMAGTASLRGTDDLRLAPPLLRQNLGIIEADGSATWNGYRFRLFLPDADLEGRPEAPGGGSVPATDAQGSEQHWCCYAWPEVAGATAMRAFFVNESGVLATWNQRPGSSFIYAGPTSAPNWDAAFDAFGQGTMADATPSAACADTLTRDGLDWTPLVAPGGIR